MNIWMIAMLSCRDIYQWISSRLLQWIIDEDIPVELRTESAIVLGSLAKGTPENINCLVDSGCVAVLLKGYTNIKSLLWLYIFAEISLFTLADII